VERGETDPALLDRLYRIDHIAVRLQRNADSLMLLAGIRETGLEASPTPLTNVARAALGQIEGYQRVRLHAETEVTVAPDIIGDLTLMLAELLENAVAFSPAGSPVEVSVRAGGDGARIEIADQGLGMSAERLAEENARLIRRERLDLVPTKVLGLFVVGILARRWGVEVVLDRTPGGGVTSRVVIPSSLLLLMSPVVPVAASASYDRARTPAEPSPAAARPRRSKAAEPTAPGALPRRIPKRETVPAEAADEGDATARPLRRRVRGATLRTTDAEAVQRAAAPSAVRPADAEEVRSALDEFEAAVERAHRDSAALTTSDTDRLDQHDLTGLPEGAEQ
jgi:anti-sigma regulatory factor (Ser/Thr protein kinase)